MLPAQVERSVAYSIRSVIARGATVSVRLVTVIAIYDYLKKEKLHQDTKEV